jgi:putative DNA primase/helicase
VQGTARELLTDPEGHDVHGQDKSAVDAAADFLRQVLVDGLVPAKSVKENANDAGVSWASVRRAADKLGVSKTKGVGGIWYWKLAPILRQDVQGAQHLSLEHVEQLELKNGGVEVPDIEDAEVF